MIPSLNIFSLNEILRLIFYNLSKDEIRKVLTVNHAFFHAGIAVVWRRLPDTAPLFTVLDAAFNPVPAGDGPLTVSLVDSANEKQVERFRRYAQCVRTVSNYRHVPGRTIHWHGLESLLTETPVVPNVLEIGRVWREMDSEASVHWLFVAMFLGPSTTSLSCFNNTHETEPGLTIAQATQILDRALKMNSPLKKLELFPQAAEDQNPLPPLVSLISCFSDLVELSLDLLLLSGLLFDHLCRLPNLRALTFKNRRGPPALLKTAEYKSLEMSPDLPLDPFPSLKTLTIHLVTENQLEEFLVECSSCLTGVAILDLQLTIGGLAFRAVHGDRVTRIFGLISNNFPALTAFTFAFPNMLQGFVVPTRILEMIHAPNLERLSLHSVRLRGETSIFSSIQGRWPNLTHLVIPYQPVSPSDLILLAGCGRLQLLRVDIHLSQDDGPAMMADARVVSSAGPMQIESQFDLHKCAAETLQDFAR
ncbi:hypothetical protein FRC08_013198 [Ceratobasidium sp. 394]|nr:hypothetical protein FRC08_013198 [Ceratobasidium sp. 394]KAG9094965.1 hypothetical protein FS749_011412 [Ceratobasidium sp. UAMH 11750]